ncbi:MAG: hypothetical protein RLZZ171_316, partial [Cyanobacteriota bacterium]
ADNQVFVKAYHINITKNVTKKNVTKNK